MDASPWPRPPETLRPDSNAAAADPVLAALEPWMARGYLSVGIFLPVFDGLGDAVLQILHPFENHDVVVTWSEVAARSGIPKGQLWKPVERPDTEFDVSLPRSYWLPQTGRLHATYRRVLVEHLGAIADHQDVHYLVWQGYGIDWPGAAEVELENRPCVLLAGPLADYTDESWFDGEPVQVCWPTDLSWSFAGDTDLPYTCVAGPDHLLDALHADPRLETGFLPRSAPTTAIAE